MTQDSYEMKMAEEDAKIKDGVFCSICYKEKKGPYHYFTGNKGEKKRYSRHGCKRIYYMPLDSEPGLYTTDGSLIKDNSDWHITPEEAQAHEENVRKVKKSFPQNEKIPENTIWCAYCKTAGRKPYHPLAYTDEMGDHFQTTECGASYVRGKSYAFSMEESKKHGSLKLALELSNGPRQESYGHPRENFNNIAKIWEVVLGCEVTAEQVGLCMIGLKLARESHSHNTDNLVDIAGYVNTLDMIAVSE